MTTILILIVVISCCFLVGVAVNSLLTDKPTKDFNHYEGQMLVGESIVFCDYWEYCQYLVRLLNAYGFDAYLISTHEIGNLPDQEVAIAAGMPKIYYARKEV